MRTSTLLRYLIGDRQAIAEIAAAPRALWIGLLFVLSAGFAREYDGADLLHEPWHLLIPLAASLLSSFLLFTLVFGIAVLKGTPLRSFFSAYRSFLGLFWMTAPLAWLYAIPYERFLTPAQAVQANLLTLGLVSAWRVALMIRVLQVLLDYRLRTAAYLVLLFADGVALTLVYFLPFPLIDIMGGIRLSEGDQVRRSVAQVTTLLGALSLPVLFLLAAIAGGFSKPRWHGPFSLPDGSRPAGRGLLVLACSAVGVWVFILPFTQPEQQLRRKVERAFDEGQVRGAIAEMSAHARNDFPPHWNPPPRYVITMSSENIKELTDILREVADTSAAPWVQAVYLEKLRHILKSGWWPPGALQRVGALLRRMPEGTALIEELQRGGYSHVAEELKKNPAKPAGPAATGPGSEPR